MCHYIKFPIDIWPKQIEFLLWSFLTFVTLCLLFCFWVNSCCFWEIWIIRIYSSSDASFQTLISFSHFFVVFAQRGFVFLQVLAPGTLATCAKSIRLVLIALIYTAICVMHELQWVFCLRLPFTPSAIALRPLSACASLFEVNTKHLHLNVDFHLKSCTLSVGFVDSFVGMYCNWHYLNIPAKLCNMGFIRSAFCTSSNTAECLCAILTKDLDNNEFRMWVGMAQARDNGVKHCLLLAQCVPGP